MAEQSLSFDDWYAELVRIAKEHHLEWCVGDPEEHREAYDEGSSPREEFEYQVECAI